MYGAGQLLTLAGEGTRCGRAMSELGLIADGAVAPRRGGVASTVNAAHALGRGADLGRLQSGYGADMLILDTDDYRNLSYCFGSNLVRTVIKRGDVVFRAAD